MVGLINKYINKYNLSHCSSLACGDGFHPKHLYFSLSPPFIHMDEAQKNFNISTTLENLAHGSRGTVDSGPFFFG